MNVWIFQDQPGSDMAAQLREHGVGTRWTWNIDRYVRQTNPAFVSSGDTVLFWQPRADRSPAGVYAVAVAIENPRFSPNEKSNWQVEVEVRIVLPHPITIDYVRRDPVLSDMQIARMPGGHIVFRVTEDEWAALQRACDRLSQ